MPYRPDPNPNPNPKFEVHRAICAHDLRERILSVSIDARLDID
jgi:hypothetical protein